MHLLNDRKKCGEEFDLTMSKITTAAHLKCQKE